MLYRHSQSFKSVDIYSITTYRSSFSLLALLPILHLQLIQTRFRYKPHLSAELVVPNSTTTDVHLAGTNHIPDSGLSDSYQPVDCPLDHFPPHLSMALYSTTPFDLLLLFPIRTLLSVPIPQLLILLLS
jgi:hypothetical protein